MYCRMVCWNRKPVFQSLCAETAEIVYISQFKPTRINIETCDIGILHLHDALAIQLRRRLAEILAEERFGSGLRSSTGEKGLR